MDNNIGEARRIYAENNGKFTQKDAANYFGVSLSTYKKWEQGQGMLNGAQLRSIADKYGVTIDYLLQVKRVNYALVEFPPDDYLTAKLTADERELVELYRQLDERRQERVLEGVRDYVIATKSGK